jgi:hypothetical protein
MASGVIFESSLWVFYFMWGRAAGFEPELVKLAALPRYQWAIPALCALVISCLCPSDTLPASFLYPVYVLPISLYAHPVSFLCLSSILSVPFLYPFWAFPLFCLCPFYILFVPSYILSVPFLYLVCVLLISFRFPSPLYAVSFLCLSSILPVPFLCPVRN